MTGSSFKVCPLALLVAGLLTAGCNPGVGARADFDFYLLDLTHEAAWCQERGGNSRQCRRLTADKAARRPLVLHGLWPENLAPGRYPANCGAPALRLERDTRERLVETMPGAIEGLAEHEWRKHGSCSGLDAETYYREAIRLTERVGAALGPPLRGAAGGESSGAMLRAAVRETDPALADSLVFVCKNLRTANPQRRQRPYLMSVRVCIDNDGVEGRPASLLNCQTVRRRDQGCGRNFFVDSLQE